MPSLISLTFELTSQGENPTPRFDPLRWQNPQKKREQLGSDLETLLGYTLVGVVLNMSQRLQPAHILCGEPHRIRFLDILLVPSSISGVPLPP